jgi:uncharacterized membrane protein
MEYQVTATTGAPPAEVWRLFADVEHWPEMTRSMREVRLLDSGPLHVGSEAIVRQPGLPRTRWRVTDMEPGRSFAWETSAGGVTTVGGHLVEPAGQGSKITLTLRQHGPLAGVMDVLLGRLSRRYLSMELEGFRAASEPASPRIS